ncbi:hypothetical protein ACT691_01590 [Vibrio metschnikovii]
MDTTDPHLIARPGWLVGKAIHDAGERIKFIFRMHKGSSQENTDSLSGI